MGIYWINEENIPGIDYEPEKIITILTNLQQADADVDMNDLIQTTLNKLLMYTRVYFYIEEQIMTRYAYPDIDIHLEEHARIAAKIHALLEMSQSDQKTLRDELLAFLTEWQNNHTRISDRKLGDFISRGAPINIAQFA